MPIDHNSIEVKVTNRYPIDDLLRDVPFGDLWPEPLPQSTLAVLALKASSVSPRNSRLIDDRLVENDTEIPW